MHKNTSIRKIASVIDWSVCLQTQQVVTNKVTTAAIARSFSQPLFLLKNSFSFMGGCSLSGMWNQYPLNKLIPPSECMYIRMHV